MKGDLDYRVVIDTTPTLIFSARPDGAVRDDHRHRRSQAADAHGRVAGPAGAAARLGIPRSTLDSKIRSLRIDKNRFKPKNF
jgi:DNA-binding NtrC family response regulator